MKSKKGNTGNYVKAVVSLTTESTSDYYVCIDSFIGNLDISSSGGADDISLIKDCINNNLEDWAIKLPAEGFCEILLKESGEWEGMGWHKYYEIENVMCVNTGGDKKRS